MPARPISTQYNTSQPRNVLVVCTQRIGDVLLSTPVARSIKASWPGTNIDYLVLPGTESVLAGNPDIRDVLVFPQRVTWQEKWRQIRRIWHRYEIALAVAPTDRARLFAWAAAQKAIGFITPEETGWLKRQLLHSNVPFDNLGTHTVTMGLRLLEPLGIAAYPDVQPPRAPEKTWETRKSALRIDDHPYVVLHPYPKFRYKMWEQEKWCELIEWVYQQGLNVLITGSNAPDELKYIEKIVQKASKACHSLAGQLSLAEIAELLKGASLFVGPDTAVTHLAAAAGTPTIGLFGPSNPVKWGPWPIDWHHSSSPWPIRGSGRQGNVWLIQGSGDCVPCLQEGCDRNLNSDSKCLIKITVNEVTLAASTLLAE